MVYIWCYFPSQRQVGSTIFDQLLKAFIMAVSIIVVAVPEGLPLAVTLSLAYSTQKMMLDNNLIRVLAACETMGNATNICSDKTGTLTQNRMTVVKAWIGGQFFDSAPTVDELHYNIVNFLSDGISVNSTANLLKSSVPGELTIVNGNKTEGALLMFLDTQLSVDYIGKRTLFDVSKGDKLITFSSSRKKMTVVLMDNIN
jgi:magnesium-transporting ATPase (P-type)